jgi:hypothetical protein
VSHIDDVRGRAMMCERALSKLAEPGEQQRDEARSRDVLDMIFLLAHTYVQAGRPDSALARLHLLLFQTADPHVASDGQTTEIYLPTSADNPAVDTTAVTTVLTVEHRCILALAYVYLLAYRRLPFMPDRTMRFPHHVFLLDWRPLARDVLAHPASSSSATPQSASLLERIGDALRRVVDLFHGASTITTTSTATTTVQQHTAKARMVAQLNLLLMKLHLGEVDSCRLTCQQYLRSAPTMPELWIVYAWIEEVAGNQGDAELILDKFVHRYPDQFAGWHAYTLFALAHNGPAAALDLLAQSVSQFLVPAAGLGPGSRTATPSRASARSVFHSLLHLPAPDGGGPLRLVGTTGTALYTCRS